MLVLTVEGKLGHSEENLRSNEKNPKDEKQCYPLGLGIRPGPQR